MNDKKIYALIFTVVLLVTSCESWLDVKPKAEIKSETLFETEQGFKDALIGVYIGMGNRFAYGKELSLGMLDVMAQQYEMYTQNEYYNLMNYQYRVYSYYIGEVWYQLYNSIANLNNLLQNIERNKAVLQPANYAMIKGEALGLRAFLHFDVLRLWGFGNVETHPEYMEKYTIPYQVKYSKEIPLQYTQKEVFSRIHQDLEEAVQLLGAYDPWRITAEGVESTLPNEDKFYDNRRERFNYLAAKATLARVYLWEGRYPEALACAQEVIGQGEDKFPWIKDENINTTIETQKDLSFSTEHVFQLYILDMYSVFKWNLRLKAADDLNINYQGFYLTGARANSNFEVPGVGSSDYRYLHHIDNKAGTMWPFLKYVEVEGYKFGSRMPLIRISEMYYIAAECLAKAGDAESLKKAVKYLNTVRSHRGIVTELPESLSADKVLPEITKEYQKEFISEGQLFFYYKRKGMTQIPWGPKIMEDNDYRLPFPDIEMEVGNLKDYKKE